jgi:hypothetical protein
MTVKEMAFQFSKCPTSLGEERFRLFWLDKYALKIHTEKK